MSEMSDGYWLRVYSGQAMQGMISELSWERIGDNFKNELIPEPKYQLVAEVSVSQAKYLLAELKKAEAQDENISDSI